MTEAIKILVDEHQNILKVASALEKECNAIDSGKKIDRDFFRNAIDFIRNYADKFHHAKEEDILFKELCKPEVNMHCNPVDQMLYEHDQGRIFVMGMVGGLEKDDRRELTKNARGYSNLIREHIFKEDNILYPMAEESLGSKMAEILKKFKKIGSDRRKEVENILNLLMV